MIRLSLFEYHFLNALGLPNLWALRSEENAGRTLYIMLA